MKQNRRTFIKVMMKTAALALLFAAVAAPLAAIDYGANLNSRTAFDGPVDFADGTPFSGTPSPDSSGGTR